MIKKFLVFSVVAFSAISFSVPSAMSGNVYLPGTQPPVLLYRYHKTTQNLPAGRTVRTQFLMPSGTPAVVETLRYRGEKLESYRVERLREGRIDELSIAGSHVNFLTTNTSTGEKQTDHDDWDANHIVIPELLEFTLANWDKALSGGSASFQLAIVEKRDTYGFFLRKDSEQTTAGKSTVTFKLGPSSFFVSMVLSPIYLVFDKANRKLLSMRNVSLPHPDAGPNEIRDIEADVVYLED